MTPTLEDAAPIVKKIAGPLALRHRKFVEFEDLYQEGMLAAWKMLPRFDPALGLTLGTFLCRRVYGAMVDFLRTMGLAKRHHEVVIHQLKFSERSEDESPNYDAVFGVEDEPVADDPEAEFRSFVRRAAPGLPARHLDVLAAIHARGLTQAAAAPELGCSPSRVSQVHAEALAYLRGCDVRGAVA
jgi:RNA polymerase sigma factor (sigma-70 family)